MANVNLIDSSNIEVNQNGSNISLDLSSEVVVDSIRTKNMFDSSSLINGVISSNAIATSTTRLCNQNFIKVKPNTTYTISFDTNNNINNINISYFTSNSFPRSSESGWLTNFTFTTGNNINYVLFSFRNSSDTTITTNNISNIQLEEGTTATAYTPYQDLNPDTSGLDNGHFGGSNGYGGFVKKTVRGNQTTYTFLVPNHQDSGFIRNALVMCGDKGFMAIRWAGNNGISPTVVWSSFTSSQVSLSHSNGTLTITFTSTVYGSVDVLFTN